MGMPFEEKIGETKNMANNSKAEVMRK